MRELPLLRDTPPAKQEAQFKQKLRMCCNMFDFEDPSSQSREKELKRATLLELVDWTNHIGHNRSEKVLVDGVLPDIVNMVYTNLFRELPPPSEGEFDPEEDEPKLEPSWPHLQVVYEFLLRVIVSNELDVKVAKKFFNSHFVHELVELFESEDPRERDYLKTILHRIYGKFMTHRAFIRKSINNVFYRFIYESERHNGIAELLEILASIISGFALPLKPEHVTFLKKALVPLHKVKIVTLYHQQLSYCITQFMEKDIHTAVPIILGILTYWPWCSSQKQVLFINELEEILELVGHAEIHKVVEPLFRTLAICIESDHFQVAERTLLLWNNECLINNACLSQRYIQTTLPIVFGALQRNSQGHWNKTVEGLALNVLKTYMEMDSELFEKCSRDHQKEVEEKWRNDSERQRQWESLERGAPNQAQQT